VVIQFDGVGSQWPTSAVVREEIRASEAPIILSFSRGKDSLGAWLGLLDAGVAPERIHPVYYYRIPGMRFTGEYLDYCEQVFGRPIMRMPHPSLYRMWANGVFQPPGRTGLIMASSAEVEITYQMIEAEIRADKKLPVDTMVATGVRAADSIARRTYLKKSGPTSHGKQRIAVIWDWTVKEVYDRIAAEGIKLPPDYEWFARINPRTGRPIKNSGRTFDGVAHQFLEPLRRYAPDDYERVMFWFPLAEVDTIRQTLDTEETR
jgi:hypothetical protein